MSVHQLKHQLTLDVGDRSVTPDVATFKVGGKIPAERELGQNERVIVTIANADGELIASEQGFINVGFKRHKGNARRPAYLERVHGIDLDL